MMKIGWLLLCSSGLLQAQSWRWDNPRPQGETLYGLHGTAGIVAATGANSAAVAQLGSSSWRNFDLDFGVTFADVWANHETEVFAVAGDFQNGGTIFFYDGANWTQMTENEFRYFSSVWGTSASNVFAVGHSPAIGGFTIRRFDGADWNPMTAPINPNGLYGVSGWGPDDAIAVGGDGILIYDGDGDNNGMPDEIWEDDTPGFLTSPYFLWDVWASGGAEAVAVGWDNLGQGMILQRASGVWTQAEIPDSPKLRAVWGADPNFIFAVGDNGVIFFYDGNWSQYDSGTHLDLFGIWGRSASEIYAVGEEGSLLRFDGEFWRSVFPRPGARENLGDVWALDDQAFVSAQGSTSGLFRFDGQTWISNRRATTTGPLWAADSEHVFSVANSGKAQMFNGQAWLEMNTQTTVNLTDVWGQSETSVFAVGNFGGSTGTLLFYDGNASLDWQVLDDDFASSINAIWGVSPNNMILSAGGVKKLFQWDGANITEITPAGMVYYANIWGPSDGHYFVAGSGPIMRYLGGWTTMNSPNILYRHIWGTSGSNVYAVGDDGSLYHYNGNMSDTWSAIDTGVSGGLNAGASFSNGDVVLVGQAGTIIRSQGVPAKRFGMTNWMPQSIPSESTPFLFGSHARSWSDMDAVGQSALLMHSNGYQWINELVTFDTDITFRWIEGFDDGSKIIVGGKGSEGSSTYGRAFRFDGSVWEQMNIIVPSPMLLGAHATGPNDVVAVGWLGNIRHYDGNLSLDWSQITTDTTKKLYAVVSDGAGGLAVGENGTVVTFNLVSGTASTIAGADVLSSVTQINSEYFVGGRTSGDLDGIIYRGGPGNWTAMTFDTSRSTISLFRSIWGDTAGNLWAVEGQVSDSSGGGDIYHYDGNASNMWVKQPSPTTKSLRSIQNVGTDPDHLIVVGGDGLVLKKDQVLEYFDALATWPQTSVLDLILNLP